MPALCALQIAGGLGVVGFEAWHKVVDAHAVSLTTRVNHLRYRPTAEVHHVSGGEPSALPRPALRLFSPLLLSPTPANVDRSA